MYSEYGSKQSQSVSFLVWYLALADARIWRYKGILHLSHHGTITQCKETHGVSLRGIFQETQYFDSVTQTRI